MEKEKGCSKCKKGFSNRQWYLVGLSLYILVASIYGTIKIVENILSIF
jgi:hypothetical protein